ncbi:MAG: bifunctional 4-hydroxy-2-oxoglutarate aldolase/2-dehydro-3-deoxy-phosphogluconate aldolase [Planctomycetota bacterium]
MITELILQHRLVAILRLDPLDNARELVDVLLDAGVRCLEFTLTNPDAPSWVSQLLREDFRFRDGTAALGVGSIRNGAHARLVLDAGAQFVVTPIVSLEAIRICVERKVPIAVGAMTPTEIALAADAGATFIKIFPARSLGPSYIRDVLAPMPELQLMPTGGIDATNCADYLRAGAVAVGVGGQLCSQAAVNRKDWAGIYEAAKRVVDACERGH